uniref:C2 NT-type domain-containing protein n=1 Tax=Oryza brachyantha TaxID=4533 RepID=J3NCC8_ORYBR
MVLGLRSKTRKDVPFHVDFNIFIQEISPWPPSESLKSLKSVVLFWENGERNSGKTNAVAPSIGSGTTLGKIEFNEFINLQAVFQKEGSSKSGKWQKNLLELNLYEPRRDKLKGQHLGTATLDLAEHAMFHEDTSVPVPLNSKRSLRNNAQPMVYLRIQPLDGDNSSVSSRDALSKEASVDRDSKEVMSATMSEEYTEDTEFASFTDDDDEEAPYPYRSDGNARISSNRSQESLKGKDVRTIGSEDSRSPFDSQREMPSSSTKVRSEEVEKYPIQVQKANGHPGNLSLLSDLPGEQTPSFPPQNALRAGRKMSFAYGMSDSHQRNFGERTYSTLTSDRVKNMRYSMRVPDFSGSIINKKVDSEKEEVKEVDSQDIAPSHDRADAFDRAQAQVPIRISNNRNDSKIRELELRVELLEAELRETAAAEIGLYSVIAEHGSSANKVHTPARRLSRHFLHGFKNWSKDKMGSAARSASSGLVLVAKACGYDVARLSFWLSNCVVLRAIVSETSKQSNGSAINYVGKTTPRRNSASMWESLNRKKGKLLSPEFDNWEDVDTFIAALKKIESWIFSRIVESIWLQAFTPHMQSANVSSEPLPSSNAKKCYGRITVVGNQQQATLSIDIWKRAFKEASEKLCPVRAAGHECGCLPLLAKLVMEQCIARLDVAMFNAILRESDDEIPTDPMSDPITDPKVLPIPSGKFSFGAGVQLKNAIGSWSRCLTDLFGMDMDEYPEVENGNGDNGAAEIRKPFYLLNALSDLLMIPKDVLMDTSTRKEACTLIFSSIIKRILDGFVPDDFCPDPVQHSLLEALESEEHLEGNIKGIRAVPCSALPILYPYPASGAILSMIGDPRKSGSAILRKSNTSDDELDELSSPLTFISKASLNPLAKLKQIGSPNTARYRLLHEVWKLDDQ